MKNIKEKPIKISNGLYRYKNASISVSKKWHKPNRYEKGYLMTKSLIILKNKNGETLHVDFNSITGGIRKAVKIIDRAEETGELYQYRIDGVRKVTREENGWSIPEEN